MIVLLGMEGMGRAGEVRRAAGLAYSSCSVNMCWLVGWMDG